MILKLIGLFFLFILLRSIIRGYFLFKTIKLGFQQKPSAYSQEVTDTDVVDAEFKVLKEE